MISAYQKMVRAEVHAVAREQGTKAQIAFSDSLAGDVNRFRLLRRLRKLVPRGDLDRLIFDEATPRSDARRHRKYTPPRRSKSNLSGHRKSVAIGRKGERNRETRDQANNQNPNR